MKIFGKHYDDYDDSYGKNFDDADEIVDIEREILFSERELARAGEIYQRTLELVEAKVVQCPSSPNYLETPANHLVSPVFTSNGLL